MRMCHPFLLHSAHVCGGLQIKYSDSILSGGPNGLPQNSAVLTYFTLFEMTIHYYYLVWKENNLGILLALHRVELRGFKGSRLWGTCRGVQANLHVNVDVKSVVRKCEKTVHQVTTVLIAAILYD